MLDLVLLVRGYTEGRVLRAAKRPFINPDAQSWSVKNLSNMRTQTILIPHYENQARL